MKTKHSFKMRSVVGLSLLIAGSILTGCGSKSSELSNSTSSAPSSASTYASKVSDVAQQPQSVTARSQVVQSSAQSVVQKLPQLIKTADISLKVKSIEPALIEIRNLVKQTKGDIYKFEDNKPNDVESHHQVSLEIKVPQSLLDDSLAKIGKLGTITTQTVKAEDVTAKLVDADARLKNLRQEETMISKIMERAGSVKDVLSVSKELSRVRSEIEEIDATQKSLRGQVAYSTINLALEESVATIKDNGNSIGVRVGETWNNSTHSAGELATNFVLLLVSLVPFMPILLLGGGAFYWYRRAKSGVSNRLTSEVEQTEP